MFENKPNKLQRRSFLCFMSDFRFCYYISMPKKKHLTYVENE